MPKFYDEPCASSGITPKKHYFSKHASGRIQRWPFLGMLLGDYIQLNTQEDAQKARNALKTFYRDARSVGRRFTVRPNTEGYWICRRVK